MPVFIQHRVNCKQALHDCDPQGGVEIDLRSVPGAQGAMYLSHDPWAKGEDFDDWLATYARLKFAGPLVLNTKEDGLEEELTRRLTHHGVRNYFFLDTTVPTMVRMLRAGHGNHLAVRVSCVEPLVGAQHWFVRGVALGLMPAPGWVWVDCFFGAPLTRAAFAPLKEHARICLVSPELQAQPLDAIEAFRHLGNEVDAICTKSPARWRSEARVSAS